MQAVFGWLRRRIRRARSVARAAAVLVSIAAPTVVTAQTADTTCTVVLRGSDFVGAAADLARVIDLQDSISRESFMLRRIGREYRAAACRAPASARTLAARLGSPPRHAIVRLLPADLLAVANSAYPRDWNDGALWAGRGVNASLTAGAEVRWGPFRAALAPVITWQQNTGYDTRAYPDPAFSPFIYPFFGTAIDAPQRFGVASFAHVDAGQSFARVDLAGFAIGFSNENVTWGPARRNPILLSGTGPGFPHVFLETGRAVDIGIAGLEFQLLWGRLEESSYFDHDPENDRRALAGLMFVLRPYIFEGLYIGGGRLHHQTWWPETTLDDILLGPYRGVQENLQGRFGNNQLVSLFFRFATAPQGLEVYGEWARDDHWGTMWVELLRNLDSSQAFTLGLQKVIRRGPNLLRVAAELSHLEDALPVKLAGRGTLAFYTNTAVTQGHTHRGQMLGAPLGTGGEAQFIGGDYFWRGGRTSFSIERARYNEEAYNKLFAATYGADARDSELSLRTGHVAGIGGVTIDAELGWSLRYNRGLLGLDTLDTAHRYRRDRNWSMRMSARWLPHW